MKNTISEENKESPQEDYLEKSLDSSEGGLRSAGTCSATPFYLKHSCREIKRRPCSYCISCLSVFLAVLVALVCNTIIDQAPLIFLTLAEMDSGQIDIRITPSTEGTRPKRAGDNQGNTRYLDYSEILHSVPPEFTGTPRIPLSANLAREAFPPTKHITPSTLEDLYFGDVLTGDKLGADVLIMDSDREREQGIGHGWEVPPLGYGECGVHRDIAAKLGVAVGGQIAFEVGVDDWLNLWVIQYSSLEYYELMDYDYGGGGGGRGNGTGLLWNINFGEQRLACTVTHIVDSMKGKVPVSDEDSYIFLEFNTFAQLLGDYFHTYLPMFDMQSFKEFIGKQPLDRIVPELIYSLPSPRKDTYKDNNYDKIQLSVSGYASRLLDQLGYYPVNIDLPVLDFLREQRFGSMFMGIILNLVVFLLCVISILLIYSLLMISVETKSFEMGVMRMIGLDKKGIIQLILIQAFGFVLPAIITAYALSFLVLKWISDTFESGLGAGFPPYPTPTSYIYAFAIGICVPLISAFLPIRAALAQNLTAALDTTRSKTMGVHISIEQLKDSHDWPLIGFGVIGIVFGFSVYYLLPLAFLSFNIQLLLWVLISILLAIIVGFMLLSLNFQYLLQLLFTYLFFFWERACIRFILAKNLLAHRMRNERTVIIYALSLGFLLFIVVAYNSILLSSSMRALRRRGQYIEIRGHLDILHIEEALKSVSDSIEDWAYSSEYIDSSQYLNIRRVTLDDFSHYYSYRQLPVAVPPNYFDVALPEYLRIKNQNKTTGLSLSEQLYTPRGSQALGIGAKYERLLNLNAEEWDSTFLWVFNRVNMDAIYEMRGLYLLSSCPGMRMSKIPSEVSQSQMMSYPIFMQLLGIVNPFFVTQYSILVKPVDQEQSTYDNIIDGISKYHLNHPEWISILDIWDFKSEEETRNESKLYLDIIFGIIIVVFMFFGFFSLTSSMTANILEQRKELAVMRSVGITRVRVIFLYIYEAFVLVFSSSFIGVLIGFIVGYTMTLQRVLFTDLPVVFIFPYVQLIMIFIASIICAVASSLSPALMIMKQPIANLVRSQ